MGFPWTGLPPCRPPPECSLFPKKKRTPPYHQYARPPHRVNLEPAGGILDSDGSVQLTLYDFGAVSISYSFPMSREGKDLRFDETPDSLVPAPLVTRQNCWVLECPAKRPAFTY